MSILLEKLEKARPVVLKAGAIVKSYLDKDKQIEKKAEIDLITVADKASEKFIFNELSKIFSEDAILAEEGHNKEGNSGYTWVIDPVDGTTSFAHGYPIFAVSLGLINSNKKPVLGLVYNPFFDELFHAVQDYGAYVNNRPIHVSSATNLEVSLLATGFPYNRRQIMPKLMKRLSAILYKVHDIRRSGSASMDICYVAAGRLDGYFEENLKPWDVAAAVAILHEAGGKTSLYDGSPADIFIKQMVATNGKIHQELLQVIQETEE